MWFKVDDSLATHPKVLEAGNAAMGLWVRAGAWCAQQLTDGFVSAAAVSMLGTRDEAETLVAADLWTEVEGGFEFHQWDERQPSRADAEDRRAKNAEKLRKWRERNQQRNQGSNPVTTEVTNQASNPAPVPVPVPVPSTSTSEIADAIRPDVEELLDLFDDELSKNGVTKLPKRSKTNRDAIRLMLDRDGRTTDDVAGAIRWAQANEFWRGNILSPSKLREKYETLRAQASRQPRSSSADNLSVVAQYEASEQRAVSS